MKRSVFFLSDSTGITAETLGHALLTQFDGLDYRQVTIPFLRDEKGAESAVKAIDAAAAEDGARPIVFSTLVNPQVYRTVSASDALVLDLFSKFLRPLELELERGSTHATGRFHGLVDPVNYDARIGAVDFALKHDDGAVEKGYHEADLILVGVSRSGKTPTCVYLSLQFGIHAANYPFTCEDVERDALPAVLRAHRKRLFGLTIDPERLRQIRSQRRPRSQYASLAQCRREVRGVEALLHREKIDYLDSSAVSIEEIATSILHRTGIERRVFA